MLPSALTEHMEPIAQASVAIAAHEEPAVSPSTTDDLHGGSTSADQDTSDTDTESISSGGLDIEVDDGASDSSLYQVQHRLTIFIQRVTDLIHVSMFGLR